MPKDYETAVVFAGHMLDRPDVHRARMPASVEASAYRAIYDALSEISLEHSLAVGLAGGACGGDILFHEACHELGIPSRMLLPMPSDAFSRISVDYAGETWTERFHRLLGEIEVECLSQKQFDRWQSDGEQNPWEEYNRWLLQRAANLATRVRVIALWDGEQGNGRGGTSHLASLAKEQGMQVDIIDSRKLTAAEGDH